ncbi:unnamed protein product [Merluccius merluccius]
MRGVALARKPTFAERACVCVGEPEPSWDLWRQASRGDPSEERCDDGVFEEGRRSFFKALPSPLLHTPGTPKKARKRGNI